MQTENNRKYTSTTNPSIKRTYGEKIFTRDDEYLVFLETIKKRGVYCSPYPGNGGDLLIRNGTLKMLEDIGITQTNNPKDAEIILYPGGCPSMWSQVIDCIKKTITDYPKAKTIIGPATFEYGYTDWPGLFDKYSDRIEALFARDKRSYNNLLKSGLKEKVHTGLSHDPSLYLLNSDWIIKQRQTSSSEYILVSLRRDREMAVDKMAKATNILKPVLSQKAFHKLTRWVRKRAKKQKIKYIEKKTHNDLPIRDIDVWTLDFEDYIDTIRRAGEIHTDRLHVMILGAMLGKTVFAYKTLYGKLENVYEHSLKDWANTVIVSDYKL